MSSKSVEEAKINFIEAMESLSVAKAVRDHPLKSVAAAAAAGAAAGIYRSRLPRLSVMRVLEFADLTLRLIRRK